MAIVGQIGYCCSDNNPLFDAFVDEFFFTFSECSLGLYIFVFVDWHAVVRSDDHVDVYIDEYGLVYFGSPVPRRSRLHMSIGRYLRVRNDHRQLFW